MHTSSKGGTILTVVLVIVGVLLLLGWVAPQVFIVYQLRNMKQTNPGLNLVPQPMPAVAAAAVKPERFSCYGYEFQTPWGKADISREYESFTTFDFASGIHMYFYNPDKIVDMFGTMRTQNAPPMYTERIFGRRDVDSRFAAQRAILVATPPAEVSLFRNREQTMFSFMILVQKSMDVNASTTEIFSFEVGDWRGFQINNGPRGDSKTKVHAFDTHDKHFALEYSYFGDHQTPASQAEINAVLLSIRPVAPLPKAPAKQSK